MRKIFLFFLPFLVCSLPTYGQIYVQNTQYNFSRFVYNPAEAGAAGVGRVTSVARLQWANIPGAPSLYTLSVDMPSEKIAGGWGLQIMRDELGPFSTTGINLAYSFHTDLEFGKLNIGVMGGFQQKAINAVWVYNATETDPIIGPPNAAFGESILMPDLSFGLMYNHYGSSDVSRFYVGLAGYSLLEPSIENLLVDPTAGQISRIPRSFYLIGGYRIDLDKTSGERNYLQPTLLVRSDLAGIVRPQIDASLYWNYKVMTFGIGYRHQDSFSGMFGFELSDRFYAGYSYDQTVSAIALNGQGASHELVLTYTFSTDGRGPSRITDILDGRSNRGKKE